MRKRANKKIKKENKSMIRSERHERGVWERMKIKPASDRCDSSNIIVLSSALCPQRILL